MPDIPVMDQKDFTDKTKAIKKNPYGDDALTFKMRIPKDWEDGIDRSSSNFVLSEKLFMEVASYYGKPTISGRSYIEIQAQNIVGNLTAEQWYIQYILESGYATEGMIVHNNNKVESLIVVMDNDFSYYLRTLVWINGNKVIMVRYYVPVTLMQEEASMQAKVLESFQLANIKDRVVDEMGTYRFLDVAEIKYPDAWRVYATPMRSVDRMDVALLNITEAKEPNGRITSTTTNGKVDVLLVSSFIQNSLLDEVSSYKKKLESDGMLVGDKMKVDDIFLYHPDIESAITEVYHGVDGANNMTEYEFWFSVLAGGNYYCFVTLLTPSRNENFAQWAENTQSYKLMLQSFKPMVGAFLGRD